MDSKEWTLEEIREELEQHAVEPRAAFEVSEETTDRLIKGGAWRAVTVEPGGTVKVWDVDEAGLHWLMMDSIPFPRFLLSLTAIDPSRREEIERLAD